MFSLEFIFHSLEAYLNGLFSFIQWVFPFMDSLLCYRWNILNYVKKLKTIHMKKIITPLKTTLVLLALSCSIQLSHGQDFTQVTKVVESPQDVNNFFGSVVEIYGNRAVVGVPREEEDLAGGDSQIFAGAIYVYERNGDGSWSEVQKIVASDRESNDNFGVAVAMDENQILVGASGKKLNGDFLVGAMYVFERNGGGVWTEVQKIVTSDAQNRDFFGGSIALDGDQAIVSAQGDQRAISSAGMVYVFERNNSGVWNETQTIVASDAAQDDLFGLALSLSNNYAVVGAYLEDDDVSGGNPLDLAGSAYILERDGSGTWSEVQKIVPADRAQDDRFGFSVSLSGNQAFISSIWESEDGNGNNTVDFAGSVYVFERDGGGVWNETQKIITDDRAEGDLFGWDLVVQGDYLLVSSEGNDTDANGGNFANGAGAIYLFERSGSTWNQLQKIVASDRGTNDSFGEVIALSGNYLLAGAPGDEQDANGNGNVQNSGSAYFLQGTLLGIDDVAFDSQLNVYPNPTKGTVTLDMGVTLEEVNIDIYNLLGTKVFSTNAKDRERVVMHLEALSAGVYLIQVQSAGVQKVIKLIKQ